MKKAAVVYWSGTGNTETMANAVAEGVKKGGAEVEVFKVADFSADKMADFGGFLFGCPATGTEELEADEFLPFFEEAEKKLSGVPVGLFGSYGWGGGPWMEDWTERTRNAGAKLIADSVISENAPDDAGIASCEALGEAMAKALA
mgnify:FL=1